MGARPQPRKPARSQAGPRRQLARLVRLCAPDGVAPRRLVLGLALILGYTALLEVDLFQVAITWKVGDYASRDIFADRTLEFVDEEATQQLRETARAAVPKVYDTPVVANQAVNEIGRFFNDLGLVINNDALASDDERLAELRLRVERYGLTDDHLRWLLEQPVGRRTALQQLATDIITATYQKREIRDDVPEDLTAAKAHIDQQLAPYSAHDAAVLRPLLKHPRVLMPNRRYLDEATKAARDTAAQQVEPVKRTLTRGQLIVTRGHLVTAQHLRDLEALGLVHPKRNYSGLFALAALVTLTLVILGMYVRLELPEIYADDKKVILLALVTVIALLLFRFLIWLKGEVPALAHPGILCGATTGMVVAVLIEYRLAMMMTGALALFLGLLMPGSAIWVAFEAWLAGRVGAMALKHVRDRTDLARAGLLVALAGAVIALVVQLPRRGDATPFAAGQLGTDLLFGFGWGLLAFLLAQGLIPLLERPFACVTPFRLLDLTNTSTDLLQRLKRQARGSFDSSLTIGDMAADACEAIGADALLARAAGYHHDIGKMRHPSWFIENQFGGENIHDKLTPALSAKAIKSHVTLGLELAEEHQLPQPLIDIIAQHHGTTMISFFYFQALEQAADGETVDQAQFTYEGPKPQFKESGIIMLADGIEAAVRAASGHGPLSEKKIQEIVQQLINRRLEEGQLDECDLTLRELHTAADAFCEFLKGMYHGRIEYPPGARKPAVKKTGHGNGHAKGDD